MKESIAELFKVFSHLAREIQAYVFTGYIVLFNLCYIDFAYNENRFYNWVSSKDYAILFSIIVAYIIGHIVLAIYCLLLEFWRFDERLYEYFFKIRFPKKEATDESIMKKKAKILKKNEKLYFHFIERNVNLSIMRWNYSGAFFIISILDFALHILLKDEIKYLLLISILSLIISFSLLLLHIYTQKENVDKIYKIKKIL